MQAANDKTVLGDFSGATFSHGGVTSTFYKKDDKFWVTTDGADGKLADFEIRYTFGVSPLQQYLIELPKGRLQALGIAWDTRAKDAGGQRWFALDPERNPQSRRSTALDGHRPELELPVRLLSRHQSQEKLRPSFRQLPHGLV